MICFYNLFDKIFSEVVLIRSRDKALHMNLFLILTFTSRFGYGCQRGEMALYGGRKNIAYLYCKTSLLMEDVNLDLFVFFF